MAQQDFVPTSDASFKTWLANLHATLPGVAARYGIADPAIAALGATRTTFEADLEAAGRARNAAKEATKKKDASQAAAEAAGRALARQIKAHSDYLASDGALLGIEGPEDTTDLAASRPRLAVAPDAGLVRVTFVKGKSDGVNLYSRRGAEPGFTFLARDTESPYVDTRPNLTPGPEGRTYQAAYVRGDGEVGQASDLVEIVVPGRGA